MTRKKRRISPVSSKDYKPSQVAHVGIIFVVGDRLLIDSTPVTEGELCAGFVNHPRGHDAFWARLEAEGRVPRQQEYFEFPRGRSVFNNLTGHHLYLDRCILHKPALVREIRRRLQLPARVEISTDSHYRCPVCLAGGVL